MDWINIDCRKLMRSTSYLGSDHRERGIWFSVLRACYTTENGGVIRGGADWEDSNWMEFCGVTMKDVRYASKLLTFSGRDVVVFGYEHEKQQECERKREAGRLAAAKRWRQRIGDPLADPSAHPLPEVSDTHHLRQCGNGSGNGNGSGSTPTHPDFNRLVEAGAGHMDRMTWEEWKILLHGRGMDAPSFGMDESEIVTNLQPLLAHANWHEVERHGLTRWLGWQLDDLGKRVGFQKKNGAEASESEQAAKPQRWTPENAT